MNTSLEKKGLARVLALAALAAPSYAGDWYVDAVNGSDANGGISPASAWKTLTHAVTTIPDPPLGTQALIHVAPGFYNAANGEGYPLMMRPGFRLRGDQGSAVTILEAPGQEILRFFSPPAMPTTFDDSSGAVGLTLRQAATGITVECDSSSGEVSPSFDDIVVSEIESYGLFLAAVPPFGVGTAACHPSFQRVTVTQCPNAVYIVADGNDTGNAIVTAVIADSVVSGTSLDGISLEAVHAEAHLTLERSRVVANGWNGVIASAGPSGDITVIAHDSLFAANGGSGVHAIAALPSSVFLELNDSTLAGNANCGLRAVFDPGVLQSTVLDNSIFFGNGVADVASSSVSASYCDSGDGALNGHPGCIAVDPLFVNVASGDYRLRFGSPCIETGDPGRGGALDLLQHPRPYDGDLDTVSAVDMGAFEFEPLHRIGTPRLGEQFGFEFWGAAGSSSTLYFAREPLMLAQSTPFGDRYLDPSAVLIATVPAQPAPPFVLRRTMPNNPALIGTTFSFQALTDSVLAPQGQAYTNPTSFVVMP